MSGKCYVTPGLHQLVYVWPRLVPRPCIYAAMLPSVWVFRERRKKYIFSSV